MYGDAIFFWVFAATLVGSALAVILARNPVHSVLFLILSFAAAAGLFLLMGAEFLGMILVVVYVGAVAVLFLFVVMMLDVDFAELKQGFLQYLPIGAVIGLVLFVELVLVFAAWVFGPGVAATAAVLQKLPQYLRPIYVSEVTARFAEAVSSERPLAERLVQFWSNHFAVSVDKQYLAGLAGSLEREAIRPHVFGSFNDMLLSVETHPGDAALSRQCPVGRPQIAGRQA